MQIISIPLLNVYIYVYVFQFWQCAQLVCVRLQKCHNCATKRRCRNYPAMNANMNTKRELGEWFCECSHTFCTYCVRLLGYYAREHQSSHGSIFYFCFYFNSSSESRTAAGIRVMCVCVIIIVGPTSAA